MNFASTRGEVRKAYVDGCFGQLHLRYVIPDGSIGAVPAVLFAASPNSGEVYRELMIELGKDRIVVAFDTPGYGESAAPPEPISNIATFADAFASALRAMGLTKITAYGHHSGAALALALAAAHPDLMCRIVVTGVPFRTDAAERETLQNRFPTFDGVPASRSYLERNFAFWVEGRPSDLPLDRAMRLFADSLSAGAAMNWLYRSVYAPGMADWLTTVRCPVRYLQIDDFLSPSSVAAAALTPHATIRVREDMHHASFVTRPADFAAELRSSWDSAE